MKKICSSIILIILLTQIATLSLAAEVETSDDFLVAYERKRLKDTTNEQELIAYEYTESLQDQVVTHLNPGDKIEDYNIVGIINIPELYINIPILNEMTNRSIELGATQGYTTDKLNNPGNTVIVAQNDDLNNLTNNASIEINDISEKVTYVIYDKFETTEEDTSFYYKDADETDGKAEIALVQLTDNNSRKVFLAKETEREEFDIRTDSNEDEPSDGWTNFSNAKTSFELISTGVKCIIEGVTLKEKHTYKMEVYSQKDITENDEPETIAYFVRNKDSNTTYTMIDNKVMALNKDYYYKIIESAENKKREIKYDEKIVFAIPTPGNRLDIWLYMENKCSGTQKVFSTPNYKRKMNYKIGKITDNNILRKFKTNGNAAFTDLYNYAKTAPALTTGTIGLDKDENYNPVSRIKLEDAYYFVYISLDDENGTFYPMDDVAIYQGSKNGKVLYHFEFANMSISDGDGGSDDPTVAQGKYPFTGRIVIGAGIVVLIGATYIFYKKNKKMEDIK